MFATDRILALSIGASKILLAEFAVKSGKPPELLNYGFSPVGGHLDPEAGIGTYLAGAVRGVMREKGIRPAPLLLCLPGQMVFPRFVRLPAVGEEKLAQMIQYEVEQNVPFPLEEIVWNSQFIGDASSGEQAAMIVAAKVENVRDVTDGIAGVGLEPDVVDVAPMALYNCLRYNETDLDGCTILLDIGARATNLIFIEDDKIYNRCIPVAGNTITQELAKGFGISPAEAEGKKLAGAFVSLGGVYAVEDPDAERMSKIVRNVVTRLHAEISRSVNFYRSQQGGSPPKRLILTGGSAVLPQLDTFFKEKLHVDVHFLNPFLNVAVGPRIDAERLSRDAFVLAEAVGLALRRSLACPVEINLMPPEIIKRKAFRKRIPYFGLAAAGILLSLGVWTMYEKQMAQIFSEQTAKVEARLDRLKAKQKKLSRAMGERRELIAKADAEAALMRERTVWLKRIDAVRRSLYDGLWLTSLTPVVKDGRVTGLSIKGCGWKDKMAEAEKNAKALGRRVTAVEELRDRLRRQPVFGGSPKSVRIRGENSVGGAATEFTLEASFAPAPGSGEGKEGAAR